jgi:hypothetical protein
VLDRENQFYLANQTEFKEKYNNKWLVIVGESLWGVFDKISDAGKAVLEHFDSTQNVFIHRPADDNKVIEIGPITAESSPDDIDVKPIPSMTVFEGDLVAYQYAH